MSENNNVGILSEEPTENLVISLDTIKSFDGNLFINNVEKLVDEGFKDYRTISIEGHEKKYCKEERQALLDEICKLQRKDKKKQMIRNMKNIRKITMAALVAFSVVIACGCTKSDDPNNGGGGNNGGGNGGGTYNGHEYVDLGLPSGTLWAICNVGANSPEEYGDYFAWGETEPKNVYSWETYKWCNAHGLTKYCTNSNYGYIGFTDNLILLQPKDDAAMVHWGSGWCVPSVGQCMELVENTTTTTITINGIKGTLFTAANGNTLFIPGSGEWQGDGVEGCGDGFGCWASAIDVEKPTGAWALGGSVFVNRIGVVTVHGEGGDWGAGRSLGLPIRPVVAGSASSEVRVTTYDPQDVCPASAVCGGEVFALDVETLTELGVCWSTELNPTAEDSHFSTSNCQSPFTCTINGLEPNTEYHVRAYASDGSRYYYGEDKSFATESYEVHGYVDLGLPSGILWATSNVGAVVPEEYGDYFAWGEIRPKADYSWDSYQYCIEERWQLTKYCNDADYGYNGFTDDLTELLPYDDAATINCGMEWRMPTDEDWIELYENTTIDKNAIQNGVKGWLFTALNGNTLFLPAAGLRDGFEIWGVNEKPIYWSSSLYMDESPDHAVYIGDVDIIDIGNRKYGLSVRPVRSSR